MIFRIRKEFRFEAAHQLLKGCLTEKCSDTVHGHSYKVEVFLISTELDKDEMVIDFGAMKSIINQVMDQWDHAVILPEALYKEYCKKGIRDMNKRVISFEKNPTAEILAYNLYHFFEGELAKKLPAGSKVIVEKVRVHETATGWAEAQGKTMGINTPHPFDDANAGRAESQGL